MKKRIKVTKANYWYTDFVGCEFVVEREDEDEYLVGSLSDVDFYVCKSDCDEI